MKTLTIKELAPYLPYGLEFKATDIDSGEFDILMIRSIDFANEELEIGATTFEFSDLGSDILKPILRPLSDLTKEIEHNGEKFVPIKELSAYSRGQTEEGTNGLEWGIIETFPYSDLVKLFKWHFDVFGLIDAGLAIDINTLSK